MLTAIEIQDVLRREMNDPVSGLAGGHVVDLSSGIEIFQYDHLTPRLMASTTKIFTAGAALREFGSATTFRTRLVANQLPDAEGTLHGDLYVVGGGDPTLGDAKHVEATYHGNGTSSDRIIGAVRGAGIRHITGGIVGDGSLFDSSSGPTGHVTALTYNRNREENPVVHAVQMIRTALVEASIPVDGSASQGRASVSTQHELGTIQSPTVESLLNRSGHDSDNFVAEMMTKLIAVQRGRDVSSTEGGAAILESFAAEMGASIDVVNGSGLGRYNLCAPAAITAYLSGMNNSEHASVFAETLPQAGAEGTLKDRMRNTYAADSVRAKTGTLTRNKKPLQDSLAGYCRGPNRAVAFSFVLESGDTRYAARSSLDRMTDALATYCHSPKRASI